MFHYDEKEMGSMDQASFIVCGNGTRGHHAQVKSEDQQVVSL